ncbi:hypothetical protein CEXT_456571 [Caerostris extrusa]|uniref:Uncharacterized protein n=1 Tax=Caerostris extrusa TaxID=172846 RepID=A0AAV4Y2S8_CAEEX|nr:hypothetical protein CEXT_456571 [Caerostris extrusa]
MILQNLVLLENFDRTSSNLPTSNLMNNVESAKNESIINGTTELNAFSDTSVPITENKDFSCANEKNPTSISTCNSGNFQTGLNLLDLVNRFYRRPCTENNTHNKQKETVTKSKSATTQNKSISKSTKNKLKSISKKSSKCQNKKKVKLAKVSQFINKQKLSVYAQSEKCIENCKKESIDMKINGSNSSLHVDKAGESVTKRNLI